MKKYLLSTSALASVALISSLASAEVELGGKVEYNLKSGDGHGGQALKVDDADLFISGSTTTDGGLEVSGSFGIELGEDGDGGDVVDDVELSISGGFGTIKLNDTNIYSGAAGSLGINAASVAAGFGGVDGNSGIIFTGTSPDDESGGLGVEIYPSYGQAPGISYFSNNLSGLSFGVTMYFGEKAGTDATDDPDSTVIETTVFDSTALANGDDNVTRTELNTILTGAFTPDSVTINPSGVAATPATTTTGHEIGVAYNADIGPGSLGLSFTSAETVTEKYTVADGFDGDVETEETQSKTSFGLSYSMGAISFAYAQIDEDAAEDKDGEKIPDSRETSSTHIGLAYNFGPGNVSYTTISTDFTEKDGDLDDSASTAVISFDYSLGEGVTLLAEKADATNINAAGDELPDVSETILGISVSF